MLSFPPQLIVRKGDVFYILYVVGGLLMTVTAGSWCVDAAQHPANLLRLSNTLIRLMGHRHQKHVAKTIAKRKLKRLYFTESLKSLFDMTTTQRGSHIFMRLLQFPEAPEKQTLLESANCISSKRCRIYYILLSSANWQHILTLCMRGDGSELKTYNPSNRLQWLVSFSGEARARGDIILLLVSGQTGQISSRSDSSDATNECYPTYLTLGLSALSVILFWMFLPPIAVCSVICLGWKLQQHIH
ncbi:uncharacterized protein LOC122973373 [Thunnus albacares]|uniref:uncharacterized protein LOC122973373 n=1 Tax=Thunnus albacares TaxID=8236 RepID=UPI001CF6F549|nr:uncharacterized protein LOC122973373 [Thunnus albacares]XP_044196760.1 uncharacterized protein LOC122973373 [Thunnus albacares]XP_044196761.1 uncharacterized protein LOC122973373 [Thunnus albacares]